MNHEVSSHAEYRDRDYHFTRQRSDRLYVPIQKAPPIFVNWLRTAFGAVILGALLAACFYAPHILLAVLQ